MVCERCDAFASDLWCQHENPVIAAAAGEAAIVEEL